MLNKNHMWYIYSSNSSGRLAELGDAYALGAYVAIHVSSTLTSPTRFATSLGLIDKVVSTVSKSTEFVKSKFVAVIVALKTKCCKVERVCIGFKRLLGHWLVLGTTHQTHTYPLLHIFQQYQHIFFKINLYAQVGSFCNKCNKCIKVRHLSMQHSHYCIHNLIRNRTL